MVMGYYDWDLDEAEYAYLKALELNLSLPWARNMGNISQTKDSFGSMTSIFSSEIIFHPLLL
jgi:hypothetical protein